MPTVRTDAGVAGRNGKSSASRQNGTAGKPAGRGGRNGRGRELVLRILSSLALGPLTLVLIWFGGLGFDLLIACLAVVVWVEWVTMVAGGRERAGVALGAAVLVAAAATLVFVGPLPSGIVIVAGAVAAAVLFALRAGAHRRRAAEAGRENATAGIAGLLAGFGMLYAALPLVSLILLRSDPEGRFAIFFLFLAVWATDIAAYAGGRAIGGPKLWPAVSPNKTWAGAISGVAGAVAIALGLTLAWGHPVGIGTAAIAALLSVASQLGDLAESAAKRGFGVKDSGHILPGHGGILDRVDGLMAASVVAAAIALPRLIAG